MAAMRRNLPSAAKWSGGPPEIQSSEIVREPKALGDGSFGKVYKGRCREKDVAVKVLHRQDFDPKTLQAFRKEVEIMSKIYHPNIVLFMGACTEAGKTAIITELMPRGDLESLLQDPNVKLSLLKRIRMARDAALGMTWLHLANPVIMHRDLKASNLLVDENFTVKICDFGLSQVKRQGETLRDGAEGAKGTPLWMSPEVMSGEKFNEKADVYSFGIVLWEILTQKEPFVEFDNFEDFRRAVCQNHVRPPIPESCPTGLRNLITQCWHPSPNQRPDFKSIVSMLEQVVVDVAIRDPDGRMLWKNAFLKESQVPWPRFLVTFQALLKDHMPSAWPSNKMLPENPSDFQLQHCTDQQLDEFAKRSQSAFYRATQEFTRRTSASSSASASSSSTGGGPATGAQVLDDLQVKMFQILLAENPTKKGVIDSQDAEGVVDMERFGKILEWFGPIVDAESKSCLPFLQTVKSVCDKQWFHGDLSTRDAENLLARQGIGTFLIRFSSTAPGYYTISKVSVHSISHQRIIHSRGRGFHVNNQRFSSLTELVEKGSKELGLMRSCGGSKIYNELYVDSHVSGYVALEDGEE